MGDRTAVCICGGGNGAHVMTGLAAASAKQPDVRVLTLYSDEAERWAKKLEEGDLVVERKDSKGNVEEIKAKPTIVTNDASKAVPGADVIIFCVPAFAHQQYFEAIAPHVGPNTAIIGLPGQPGFEFQCFHILKDRAKNYVILNYETLPWACRISEFGRKVQLLGTKETLTGSKATAGKCQPKEDPAEFLQSLLGERPKLEKAHSYLELTLMAMTFSHPPLMYGQWKEWNNKPFKQSDTPLFYQGVSKNAASIMSDMSDEVMSVASSISQARTEVDMSNMESAESWLTRNYQNDISDPTSLYTALRTNSSYDGLLHPVKEVSPGQFEPDFKHRYLTEDVPFGLAVVKGVAQIMGVATPKTDMVMHWAQHQIGKEFLVGSELKGKDLKATRAPQVFGFNNLEDLLAIV